MKKAPTRRTIDRRKPTEAELDTEALERFSDESGHTGQGPDSTEHTCATERGAPQINER